MIETYEDDSLDVVETDDTLEILDAQPAKYAANWRAVERYREARALKTLLDDFMLYGETSKRDLHR